MQNVDYIRSYLLNFSKQVFKIDLFLWVVYDCPNKIGIASQNTVGGSGHYKYHCTFSLGPQW